MKAKGLKKRNQCYKSDQSHVSGGIVQVQLFDLLFEKGIGYEVFIQPP